MIITNQNVVQDLEELESRYWEIQMAAFLCRLQIHRGSERRDGLFAGKSSFEGVGSVPMCTSLFTRKRDKGRQVRRGSQGDLRRMLESAAR